MLMLKILENDLHRSHSATATPYMVEIPASPAFLPAIVSSTRGKFLVSRNLTPEGRIKVGVFESNPDKIDDFIPAMLTAALELSRSEGWRNVFGPKAVKTAFEYVRSESHLPVQPHVCIVPTSWDEDKVSKTLGLKGSKKYQKYCHVIHADVPFIAFLSKPEMVGLYTHFLGGPAALLLHNVRRGIAFCA